MVLYRAYKKTRSLPQRVYSTRRGYGGCSSPSAGQGTQAAPLLVGRLWGSYWAAQLPHRWDEDKSSTKLTEKLHESTRRSARRCCAPPASDRHCNLRFPWSWRPATPDEGNVPLDPPRSYVPRGPPTKVTSPADPPWSRHPPDPPWS